MNLFGKVLIVLNLLLSLMFMSFALMVYATHRNWRDAVENTQATATKPLGLRPRLEAKEQELATTMTELEQSRNSLALERAARRQALVTLETRVQELNQQRADTQKQYETLLAQAGERAQLANQAENNMKRLMDENEKVRGSLRQTQQDRDSQFQRVLELTDNIQQRSRELQHLKSRQEELTSQLGQMTRVLDSHGLSPFTPLHDVPPKLEGYVTVVDDGLIEVSLGSHDGLQVGHELDVYRAGGEYLGRIRVTELDPDRAVTRVLPDFRQGTIKRGDRVATRVI